MAVKIMKSAVWRLLPEGRKKQSTWKDLFKNERRKFEKNKGSRATCRRDHCLHGKSGSHQLGSISPETGGTGRSRVMIIHPKIAAGKSSSLN